MLPADSRVAESLQVLSDVLKRKEIYSYFNRSALEKAHAYQAQGRVTAVDVSDDLTRVTSRVRGSEGRDYRVDFLLKLNDDVARPSAKLERLIQMVGELLSEGRKIIIFSQFTSMLDLIRKRFDADGLRYSLLTGETKNRKAAIETFQGGAVDVF